MGELNVASQKGLSDRFDSTIGANTVMMPYGGKTQLTPAQAMVAKIPIRFWRTNTCSVMAWGFNPYISEENQFRGAQLAVIESIAKLIAVGGTRHKCWLSFQEYFEKIGTDPEKWGKPFQSLLGALKAQLELGLRCNWCERLYVRFLRGHPCSTNTDFLRSFCNQSSEHCKQRV